MLSVAGFAVAVCLCVPVSGLIGARQNSSSLFFLLTGEIIEVRDKVITLENRSSRADELLNKSLLNEIGQLRSEVKGDVGQLKVKLYSLERDVSEEIRMEMLAKTEQLKREVRDEIDRVPEKMHSMEIRLENRMYNKALYKNQELKEEIRGELIREVKIAIDMVLSELRDVNDRLDSLESSTCESGLVEFRGNFMPRTVKFKKEFKKMPVLSHGITLLDVSSYYVMRSKCVVSDVRRTQFVIQCKAWATTETYNIVASWIAC